MAFQGKEVRMRTRKYETFVKKWTTSVQRIGMWNHIMKSEWNFLLLLERSMKFEPSLLLDWMLKDIKICVALGWSNWTMCNKNIRFVIKIIKILKEPKFGEKLKLKIKKYLKLVIFLNFWNYNRKLKKNYSIF